MKNENLLLDQAEQIIENISITPLPLWLLDSIEFTYSNRPILHKTSTSFYIEASFLHIIHNLDKNRHTTNDRSKPESILLILNSFYATYKKFPKPLAKKIFKKIVKRSNKILQAAKWNCISKFNLKLDKSFIIA